jgi:drug/metabolite transporter (DMT)-like permease
MNATVGAGERLSLGAALYAAFLCVLFGGNAVAIKFSLTGLGVFTTAAVRFATAAVALLLWARLSDQRLALRPGQWRPLLVLTMIFIPQLVLFYIGISRTSAGRGSLIINLVPFFIQFLAHRFIPGDRLTLRKLSGTLLGFAGLSLLLLERRGLAGGSHGGDLLVLAAALAWACNAVYTKRIIADFEPLQLVLYPMLPAIPAFALMAWCWDRPPVGHTDGAILLAMGYQSLVTAAYGFIAWTRLQARYGVSTLHTFVLIMPLVGVLLGALLLGEPITGALLLSTTLIVAGLAIVCTAPGA